MTGFQIFNGENLVARGAMGIDKTRGRQPILQMRLLVGENGKAAKLNFSYNGNNTFNGNASSHQVLKNGKFSLSQHYGETCHLEYSESPLHYDLLTNTCGRSLRNIDELPTAYQFEQFQAQLNQRVENFVSGKSTAKQKAELKEKRRLRHQEKQVLKFELESLKSKYEPEIKKLKAKIEELEQTETQQSSNLSDSNVELTVAKHELELLQKQLKQETKAVQRRYSTGIHPAAFDPKKDSEPVDFRDVKFFTNKRSIRSIFRNEGISLRVIPAYPNKEVLEQLKSVKGTPAEKAEQIKNIFCKEIGIDGSLVPIRSAGTFELGTNSLAYLPHSGEIIYNEEIISKLSTVRLAGVIRHELDHLEVFGKMAKALGIEKFKKLIAEKYPPFAGSFNTTFYENLCKQLNTQGFDYKLYEQAYRKYEGLNNQASITLTKFKNIQAYYENPLESRAYGIQMSLTKSLGAPDINVLTDIHLTKQINAEIERIEHLTPQGFNIERYINNIIKSIKTRMGSDNIEANEFIYNLLQELRKV